MTLNEMLLDLVRQGCFPCVSYRGGGIWRAHVNAAGNQWEDADTPERAMKTAVVAWKAFGKPMDGYGATP